MHGGFKLLCIGTSSRENARIEDPLCTLSHFFSAGPAFILEPRLFPLAIVVALEKLIRFASMPLPYLRARGVKICPERKSPKLNVAALDAWEYAPLFVAWDFRLM